MRTLTVGGRQGRGDPPAYADRDKPSLMARPAFWIGGALSLCVWVGIAYWGFA
jgi:hypothetical protein